MFAIRIRNTVLALAGVVIVATTLMTTVAVAAPADSLPHPSDSERVGIKTVDIPFNDIQVKLVDHTGTGEPGHRAFATFEAKNVGSQPMTFKLQTSWSRRKIADDTYYPNPSTQTVTLAPGQAKPIEMACDPKTAEYECFIFIAYAHTFDKYDWVHANDGADWKP